MTVTPYRKPAAAGDIAVGRLSLGPTVPRPMPADRQAYPTAETPKAAPGIFTISLDFELYWGMHDHSTLESCEQRLLGTRRAIPHMLERFAGAGVHATWATVGMLFHETTQQARASVPALLPHYTTTGLSPYERDELLSADQDESQAPCLLARSLIRQIRATANQEVGSHTYSHYYCLEPGQSLAAFEADLRQAVAVAARQGIALESLIFPRNQYSPDHVAVAMQLGFKVVRCQRDHWLYKPRNRSQENAGIRLLRLLDSYLPLSGSNVIDASTIDQGDIICLPDSRFLRPFSPKLAMLDRLRLYRIKRSMTQAARTGGIYHLWWHPHNFGTHLGQNLAQLDDILTHYGKLETKYGFTSQTMTEIADAVRARRPHTHGQHYLGSAQAALMAV